MTTRRWDLRRAIPAASLTYICTLLLSLLVAVYTPQDMTTRLWDLRYPATSFALLKAHIGAVRALRFRCACCWASDCPDFSHCTRHGMLFCREGKGTAT
jgi:hypothetical protein